jgi:hypothetical protein
MMCLIHHYLIVLFIFNHILVYLIDIYFFMELVSLILSYLLSLNYLFIHSLIL